MDQIYNVSIEATLINGKEISAQLDKLQAKLFEVKELQNELSTMLESLSVRITQV